MASVNNNQRLLGLEVVNVFALSVLLFVMSNVSLCGLLSVDCVLGLLSD